MKTVLFSGTYYDDDDALELQENHLAVNELIPSLRWYVCYTTDIFNFNLNECLEYIEKLELPEGNHDLQQKEMNIANLQIVLIQLEVELIRNKYLKNDINEAKAKIEDYIENGFVKINIHDINRIQRSLYRLTEEIADEYDLKLYNGYIEDLGSTFSDLVKADVKLIKYYISIIDKKRK